MNPSKFMFMRCGLPVTQFASSSGWKHSANGHTKSCGNPPHVVEREKYEEDMSAIAASAKTDVGRL